MSKHRTSELTGPLLDAAVAMIEGYTLDADGDNLTVREPGGAPSKWAPSTDSAQGDLIIDRERIWTGYCDEKSGWQWPGMWFAHFGEDYPNYHQIGPTRLIAAMRAFVESRLGESIALISAPLTHKAVCALATLNDDQRLQVFSLFCAHCGRRQPDGQRCQCWNDE